MCDLLLLILIVEREVVSTSLVKADAAEENNSYKDCNSGWPTTVRQRCPRKYSSSKELHNLSGMLNYCNGLSLVAILLELSKAAMENVGLLTLLVEWLIVTSFSAEILGPNNR